ncbi:hypothetical protein GGX14DRAFT_606708 [Mycena pura]|uniref:Uncharacterized protein n=1 Tax=Mycena pura TaxID=153505 RepID=A0AAD6VLG2_9AGAR|nr:hypothetical protein GGX14DRAFT_606708 [Mycena pura]
MPVTRRAKKAAGGEAAAEPLATPLVSKRKVKTSKTTLGHTSIPVNAEELSVIPTAPPASDRADSGEPTADVAEKSAAVPAAAVLKRKGQNSQRTGIDAGPKPKTHSTHRLVDLAARLKFSEHSACITARACRCSVCSSSSNAAENSATPAAAEPKRKSKNPKNTAIDDGNGGDLMSDTFNLSQRRRPQLVHRRDEDLNCDNLNLNDVQDAYRTGYEISNTEEEEEAMQHEGDTIAWIYESPHPRGHTPGPETVRSRSRTDNQMRGGGGGRPRAASQIRVQRNPSASRAASPSIASTTQMLPEPGDGVLQSPRRHSVDAASRSRSQSRAANQMRAAWSKPTSQVRGRSASRAASRSIASTTQTLTEPGDWVLQSPRQHSVGAASRSRSQSQADDHMHGGGGGRPRAASQMRAQRDPSASRAASRSIASTTQTLTEPGDGVLQSPRRHSIDAASRSRSRSRADDHMHGGGGGRPRAASQMRTQRDPSASRAASRSIASTTQTLTEPGDSGSCSPRADIPSMRRRTVAASHEPTTRYAASRNLPARGEAASPLPPSSPRAESELDHSSDEYGKYIYPGEQRKQEREERLMLQQDRADYQEYLEEAEQTGFRDDSDSDSTTKPSSKKGRGKARGRMGKGKGKARAASLDNSDSAQHKRGPLSAEFQERAIAAQQAFYDSIEEIAKAAGKPVSTIHQMLGTTTKFARESQSWNVWQSWYSWKHPKETRKGELYHSSRAEYEKALSHLSDEQRKESRFIWKALPWLLEWDEKKNSNAIAAWRENGDFKRQLIMAVKPLSHMCRLLNDNYGVHVFGYAIDIEGEASIVFGGSDSFSKISAEQKVTLSKNVKDFEVLFRTQDMRRRGLNIEPTVLPRLFPNISMDTDEKEDRDFLRTKFGQMMRRQLGLESEGKFAETTMAWNERFLYLAWKGKFRIINYPLALQNIGQVIGGNYNPKKPNVPEFQAFMPAFEKASSDNPEQYDDDIDTSTALAIVPWNDAEKLLPLHEQRDVPLVISAPWSDNDSEEEREILRYVKDCKEYHEELVKAAKQRIQQQRPAQRQRQQSPDQIRRRQVSPRSGLTVRAGPTSPNSLNQRGRSLNSRGRSPFRHERQRRPSHSTSRERSRKPTTHPSRNEPERTTSRPVDGDQWDPLARTRYGSRLPTTHVGDESIASQLQGQPMQKERPSGKTSPRNLYKFVPNTTNIILKLSPICEAFADVYCSLQLLAGHNYKLSPICGRTGGGGRRLGESETLKWSLMSVHLLRTARSKISCIREANKRSIPRRVNSDVVQIGGAELGGEQVSYRGQRSEGTCGGQKAGGPRGAVSRYQHGTAAASGTHLGLKRGAVQTEGAVQSAGATCRKGRSDVRLPGTVCSGHTPGDHVGDVTEIWEPSAGIGTQQWEAPSKSTQRAGRHAHSGEHAEGTGAVQDTRAACRTHGRRAEHTGGVQNARAACKQRRARGKRAEGEGRRRRRRRNLGAVKTQQASRSDAPSENTRTEGRASCVRVTGCHDVIAAAGRPLVRVRMPENGISADSQWLVCLRPGAREELREGDEGKKKEPTRSRQNKPP